MAAEPVSMPMRAFAKRLCGVLHRGPDFSVLSEIHDYDPDEDYIQLEISVRANKLKYDEHVGWLSITNADRGKFQIKDVSGHRYNATDDVGVFDDDKRARAAIEKWSVKPAQLTIERASKEPPLAEAAAESAEHRSFTGIWTMPVKPRSIDVAARIERALDAAGFFADYGRRIEENGAKAADFLIHVTFGFADAADLAMKMKKAVETVNHVYHSKSGPLKLTKEHVKAVLGRSLHSREWPEARGTTAATEPVPDSVDEFRMLHNKLTHDILAAGLKEGPFPSMTVHGVKLHVLTTQSDEICFVSADSHRRNGPQITVKVVPGRKIVKVYVGQELVQHNIDDAAAGVSSTKQLLKRYISWITPAMTKYLEEYYAEAAAEPAQKTAPNYGNFRVVRSTLKTFAVGKPEITAHVTGGSLSLSADTEAFLVYNRVQGTSLVCLIALTPRTNFPVVLIPASLKDTHGYCFTTAHSKAEALDVAAAKAGIQAYHEYVLTNKNKFVQIIVDGLNGYNGVMAKWAGGNVIVYARLGSWEIPDRHPAGPLPFECTRLTESEIALGVARYGIYGYQDSVYSIVREATVARKKELAADVRKPPVNKPTAAAEPVALLDWAGVCGAVSRRFAERMHHDDDGVFELAGGNIEFDAGIGNFAIRFRGAWLHEFKLPMRAADATKLLVLVHDLLKLEDAYDAASTQATALVASKAKALKATTDAFTSKHKLRTVETPYFEVDDEAFRLPGD